MNLQTLYNKAIEYENMKKELERLTGFILTDEQILDQLRNNGFRELVNDVCGHTDE